MCSNTIKHMELTFKILGVFVHLALSAIFIDSPLYNVKREIIDGLMDGDKLVRDGLIFKLNLEN